MSEHVEKDWREDAACRGSEGQSLQERARLADAFHPPYTPRLLDLARVVCHHCPVKETCLEAALVDALDGRNAGGVRGGLTEEERRPMLQARARARRSGRAA